MNSTNIRYARSWIHRILILTGCMGVALAALTGSPDNASVTAQLDSQYSAYLEGDLPAARNSLLKCVALLEGANLPKPGAKAHGLWLTHSRLSVLERRAGRALQSEAQLLKAKYWYLLKLEQTREPLDTSIALVNGYSAEKCQEIVDRFDIGATAGRGAQYSKNK